MIFSHDHRPGDLALDDGARQRSWAELSDRATRAARLLREDLGIRPGDHAALLMGNRAEFIELTLGAILAGVWLTPINRHLTPAEIAYVVRDSGARVVFADEEHGPAAREAGAPQLILAGTELDGALAAASDAPLPLDGPGGATMIYTSGTSGKPKGVKRGRTGTVAQALAGGRAYGRSLGLDGAGPHLVTGPLYHAAPLLYCAAPGAPDRPHPPGAHHVRPAAAPPRRGAGELPRAGAAAGAPRRRARRPRREAAHDRVVG
jgi:acyl-CoA synthetase (AMP-forming)/AMP-acid ligase II